MSGVLTLLFFFLYFIQSFGIQIQLKFIVVLILIILMLFWKLFSQCWKCSDVLVSLATDFPSAR